MVSDIPYKRMTCSELYMQRDAEVSNLEKLADKQVNARSWDIALNLLIVPGVGAVTGDSEEAIAQTKGRVLTIQQEIAERCRKDDEDSDADHELEAFFKSDENSGVNKAIAKLKETYGFEE